MKPHPRIRKTIKWGGLAGAVVCIALMLVSRWRTVHVGWVGHAGMTVHRGRAIVDNDYLNRMGGTSAGTANRQPVLPMFRTLRIETDPPTPASPAPAISGAPAAADFSHEDSISMTEIFDYLWAVGSFRNTTLVPGVVSWQVVFPLYAPLILLAGASAGAWVAQSKAAKRARLGLCPKCDYDRTGLAAEAVCPECGAAPTA